MARIVHGQKKKKYKITHIVNLSCHPYLRNHPFHNVLEDGGYDLFTYIDDIV